MAKIEVTEEMKQAVCEAIAEALGDAYDCTRVWSAWGYGTMGPDDFSLVAEDDSRLAEIADAAINSFIERVELENAKALDDFGDMLQGKA